MIRYNMVNSISLGDRELSYMKTTKELEQTYKERKINAIMEGKDPENVPYPVAIIRCLRARNTDKLLISLAINKAINREEIDNYRTAYASTGTIYWKTIGLPNNFYVDNEKVRNLWREKYDQALTGQDLVIDIDRVYKSGETKEEGAKSFNKAYEVACTIKELFDKLNIPYSVSYSGSKGFHIRILSVSFKQAFPNILPLELEPLYKKFVQNLVDYLSLDPQLVDKSTLYRRQPLRIPYSLHSSGYVCLPLSDKQFADFDKEMSKPDEVVKLRLYDPINFKEKGFNRSLCYRYGDPKKLARLVKSVTV